MRHLFGILTMALITGLTVAGQSNWINYQSPEGRYNVSIPKQPNLSSQDKTAPTGETVHQYHASATDGNGLFMIGYYDYPSDMTFSLEKARDGMVESRKATLLADEVISLGAAPGRAIKFLTKSNDIELVDRARFYDVNKRVYILQCIFPKAEDGPALSEKCDKFADSFRVSSN